jgi:Histidine kinase-, DNA gyrase B-, and HSP90-like ATPase
MPADQSEYGQPHPTRPSPTTQILDLERWLKERDRRARRTRRSGNSCPPSRGLQRSRLTRIRADHAGVGLGLAIVKSITQAHDGTLALTPRAAGGLRATVQLPAAPPHPRGVGQRANGLGTGLEDKYRIPQRRTGHLVNKSPEGA